MVYKWQESEINDNSGLLIIIINSKQNIVEQYSYLARGSTESTINNKGPSLWMN